MAETKQIVIPYPQVKIGNKEYLVRISFAAVKRLSAKGINIEQTADSISMAVTQISETLSATCYLRDTESGDFVLDAEGNPTHAGLKVEYIDEAMEIFDIARVSISIKDSLEKALLAAATPAQPAMKTPPPVN